MAERHVWIPMADGVRLAASLYLPDSADPCPVLLEALPYRKDDVAAGYRAEYRRLAGEHGYAVARVDLRGTGSSEGVATDEYPPQELADLCRAIEWLAAQPWSTGAVGVHDLGLAHGRQQGVEIDRAAVRGDRPGAGPGVAGQGSSRRPLPAARAPLGGSPR
jgi:predicted acyl esterase